MSTPPDPIPESELALARTIARQLQRVVFGVVTDAGGRRLAHEPPDDTADIAYLVEPRGRVRYGPGGRAAPPPPGGALIHEVAAVPALELAVAQDLALAAGATVFVAAPADDAPESEDLLSGARFLFEPPTDGTLRFAVRPPGTLLVGESARLELPGRVSDPGWATRTGPALRALRRLDERGEALAELPVVSARDWGRVERLVPKAERDALHPRVMVGLSGADASDRVAAAIVRELERLRDEAAGLFG